MAVPSVEEIVAVESKEGLWTVHAEVDNKVFQIMIEVISIVSINSLRGQRMIR